MLKDNIYLKEINLYTLFKYLLFLIFAYFLRSYYYKLADFLVIRPLHLDEIEKSIDLDCVALVIVLLSIGYTIFYTVKKFYPCINSLVTIVLILISYLVLIRFSGAFILEPLYTLDYLKYTDILLLGILIILSKFKYYQTHKTFIPLNGFIEDNFHPELNRDFLGRSEFSTHVVIKILDTLPLKKAFVIAINAQWGYGKSGFMLMLQHLLNSKNEVEFEKIALKYNNKSSNTLPRHIYDNLKSTIVINYNPWKNFDDKILIKDFFSEFSAEIKKYDAGLAQNLKDYSKYLSKLDDSKFGKLVDIAIDNFKQSESLNQLFASINSSIDRIQKRIVVFIDDLDRLTGDELIDVIKLIRNTANFRNTFFVVAYDHNYVLNTINKRNLISNKEEYLQKIVQLEITLPYFKKELLLTYLDEQLIATRILQKNVDKIRMELNEVNEILYTVNENAIDDASSDKNSSTNRDAFINEFFWGNKISESLTFQVLQNARDVVRFLNSFKISYELIGEIGDGYEIILLEFLKIKYLSIYNILSSKRILEIKENKYAINSKLNEYFGKIDLSAINISKVDIPLIEFILDKLFNSDRKRHFRSISNPKYFDLYFSFYVTNIVALRRIEDSFGKGIESVKNMIDESANDGSLDDIRNYLDNQTFFTNKIDFEIVLSSLFYISKYDGK